MMDRVPIDSALILTTTRIFNRPGEPAPASPRTMVGGLSLFQRTILTLQRGGISRFIVLAGNETEDLRRQLRSDERIRGEVRWLPVLEFSPGDPRTWEIFPGLFGAPYLVVGTGAVFPASLVARVRQEARNSETLVVLRGRVEREGIRHRVGAGPDEAERQLLRRLKGGLEGFVDRHFNRRCSRWLTRWLLRTPLTPNGVTVLATAVGVLASVAFGVGGYAAGIIGALLFQLSAIL